MSKLIKGLFITVEGIEGAGKTTAIRFMQEWLIKTGISHSITREPGGTPIAEMIRHLFLDIHAESMCADTELLLMFAARAQHISQWILPHLIKGEWVMCDRFTDATYAYQGGGRGIEVERIAKIEKWVQGDFHPDHTILLDLPVDIALSRVRTRLVYDRIEQEDISFFSRVRQTYLSLSRQHNMRYTIIDASQPLSIVQNALILLLKNLWMNTARDVSSSVTN